MSATRRTMLVGMVSKRALLELLSRDELLAAVDLFGVDVPDRRAKDGIVDALVASRKVSLAQALADFPRDRLKDLCRSLGLDDAGREKTALIDRLTGASARQRRPVAAPAPTATARATAPATATAPPLPSPGPTASRPPPRRPPASSPASSSKATCGRPPTSCAGPSTRRTTRTTSSGCCS